MIDLTAKTEARIKFEETLRKHVVGQDSAIEQVSTMYETVNAGIVDEHKPLCNMLFLGPTGVGKTLLVNAVADAIHGSIDAKTVINCAEYSEDHQIARIIGSPPGYIGHDTCEPVLCPTNLTRGWVDKGPRISILLFDEVEKASPKLHQLMLGIMDKATMTDGKNREVNLNRCMIFMTSNVGSRAINQEHIGLVSHDVNDEFKSLSTEAVAAAKKKFDPEFLGRLNNTVVFRSLTLEELDKILDLELWKVYERCLKALINNSGDMKNVFTLKVSDSMRSFLLQAGPEKKYGARNLAKTVNDFVATPLATIIATGQVKTPGVVYLDVQNDATVAEFREHHIEKGALQIIALESGTADEPEKPVEVLPTFLRQMKEGEDYFNIGGN